MKTNLKAFIISILLICLAIPVFADYTVTVTICEDFSDFDQECYEECMEEPDTGETVCETRCTDTGEVCLDESYTVGDGVSPEEIENLIEELTEGSDVDINIDIAEQEPGVIDDNENSANEDALSLDDLKSEIQDNIEEIEEIAEQIEEYLNSVECGDPVRMATGDFLWNSTDLSYTYYNQEIGIQRDFQDSNQTSHSFGKGWSFNYDTRIIHGFNPRAEEYVQFAQDKLANVTFLYEDSLTKYNNALNRIESALTRINQIKDKIEDTISGLQNGLNETSSEFHGILNNHLRNAQQKLSYVLLVLTRAQNAKQGVLDSWAGIERIRLIKMDLTEKLDQAEKELAMANSCKLRNRYTVNNTDPDYVQLTGNTTLTLIDETGNPHLYFIDTEPDYESGVYYVDGSINYYPQGTTTTAQLPNDDKIFIQPDGSYVLIKKDKTEYKYSFYGQLEKILDTNGNEIFFVYDSSQYLIKISDDFGRKIFITRDNEKITTITDPKKRVWQYQYDGQDRLILVTDAEGHSVGFSYDDNYITEVIKPDGSKRQYFYSDLNGEKVLSHNTNEEGNTEYFRYYDGYTEYENASGIIEKHYYNERNLETKVVYADGSFEEMEYDKNNNLIRRVNELGYAYEYSYDENRNVIQSIDPEGNIENWTYNKFNKINSYTNKMGNITYYYYDSKGNLASITYPDSTSVSYNYNAYGQVTEHIDQLGNITYYSYDNNGYLEKATDAEGNTSFFENDIIGNIIKETDPLGNHTTYEYNNDNKVVKVTDALGNSEEYVYNNRKDLMEQIDKKGNTTNFEYDKRHKLLKVVNAMGEETAYTYRADGKLITQTIEGVNHLTYDYDLRGNLSEKKQVETNTITRYEYDQTGQIVSIIDPNGNRIEYVYNELGYVERITDAEQNTSFFEYDAQGNNIATTDKNGNTTYYEYDNMNRRIRDIDPYYNTIEYIYDDRGKITQVKDKNSSVKSFEYDSLGRLIAVNDALGYTESTEYDARGNIIKKTDKRGNSTMYAYDSLDRVIKKQDTLGGIEEYTYDELGNLLTSTNANGNTGNYEYNPLNRLIKETDPYGSVTEHEYNYLGNVIKKRDALGNERLYEYDELGRLVKAVDPLGASRRYEYDANGNVIAEIDELNRPNYYTYDSQNRVIKEINALEEEVSYIYDAEGNLTGEIDAKGDLYTYDYDKLNRIVEETNRLGNKQYYSYDPQGNLIKKIDFNGNAVNYENDALGRLHKVLFADASTELYGYDANNNIVFAENQNKRLEYEYDELNRLLIAKDLGIEETNHYSYDSVGNRLSLSWLEDKRQIQYTYGKNNELLTIIDPDKKITHFEYDALGRPAKKVFPNNVVTEIEYDPASRVTAIKNKNKYKQYGYNKDFESIAYVYNDAGERIFDITNKGDITSYIYDDLGRIKQVYYPFKSDKKLNDFKERIDLGIYPEHSNYRKKDKGFSFTIPQIPEWHNFYYKNDKDSMGQGFNEFLEERKEIFKDIKGYSKKDKICWNIKPEPGATEFAVQLQIDFETEVLLEEIYSKIATGHNNLNTKQWMWIEKYSYDVNSNRTAKANGWGKIEYSYNSAHQITEAGNIIYEHDLNGNLIKESLGDIEKIYDYNYDDRVVNISSEFESFTKANENIFEHGVTYAYDAFGRRISRVEYKDYKNTRGSKEHNWYKDTQQSYLYDGLRFEILAEIKDDEFMEKPGTRYGWYKKDRFKPISENIYANGKLLCSTNFNDKFYKSGNTSVKNKDYYIQDILGSTMLVTDSHGNVKNNYKYDAFGNIYDKRSKHGYNSWGKNYYDKRFNHGYYSWGKNYPDNANEYLYNGKRYDPAVGLYDYGFRDYNPVLGRWTTVDPIRSGSNWYVYCNNNPVKYVDPLGLQETVYAIRGGTVVQSGWHDPNDHGVGLGYHTVIDTGDGYVDLYGHLEPGSTLPVGTDVEAGDPIGTMGDPTTGESTGPHVHVGRWGPDGPVHPGHTNPFGTTPSIITSDFGDVDPGLRGDQPHRGVDHVPDTSEEGGRGGTTMGQNKNY